MQDLPRYNCQAAVKDRKTGPICTSLTLDNREAARGWFIKNTFMLSSSTWFINLNITADFVPFWPDQNTGLWLVERIPGLGCDWLMLELVIVVNCNDDVESSGRGVIRFKLYNWWRQHCIITLCHWTLLTGEWRLCQYFESHCSNYQLIISNKSVKCPPTFNRNKRQ